jgi:hypothetical protein
LGELDDLWKQIEDDPSALPSVRAEIEAHLTSQIFGEMMTEGRPVRAEVWARFYASVTRLSDANDSVQDAAVVADAMLAQYEQRFPMYEVGPLRVHGADTHLGDS